MPNRTERRVNERRVNEWAAMLANWNTGSNFHNRGPERRRWSWDAPTEGYYWLRLLDEDGKDWRDLNGETTDPEIVMIARNAAGRLVMLNYGEPQQDPLPENALWLAIRQEVL